MGKLIKGANTPLKEAGEKVEQAENRIKLLKKLLKGIKEKLKSKSISLYDKTKLEIEYLDTEKSMAAKELALTDRKNRIENVLIPRFDKETKECNANFLEVTNKARAMINDKKVHPMMQISLKTALEEYPKDNKDQELKNLLYFSIKANIDSFRGKGKRVRKFR